MASKELGFGFLWLVAAVKTDKTIKLHSHTLKESKFGFGLGWSPQLKTDSKRVSDRHPTPPLSFRDSHGICSRCISFNNSSSQPKKRNRRLSPSFLPCISHTDTPHWSVNQKRVFGIPKALTVLLILFPLLPSSPFKSLPGSVHTCSTSIPHPSPPPTHIPIMLITKVNIPIFFTFFPFVLLFLLSVKKVAFLTPPFPFSFQDDSCRCNLGLTD